MVRENETTSHIILDLPGDSGKDLTAPGASWTIEGLCSSSPVIVLEDGTRLPAVYEQPTGTQLLFSNQQEQSHQLIGKTNAILRIDSPPDSKKPQAAVKAADKKAPADKDAV